jgi:hypothetical protein
MWLTVLNYIYLALFGLRLFRGDPDLFPVNTVLLVDVVTDHLLRHIVPLSAK